MNDVPSRDRDIAMVFQSYALYPHLSVYENIAFGLRVKKMPKDEIDKRVRNAARILDLEPLLKRKPRALSGGQRQRVAMGRAIVRQPAAFLMDEPLRTWTRSCACTCGRRSAGSSPTSTRRRSTSLTTRSRR